VSKDDKSKAQAETSSDAKVPEEVQDTKVRTPGEETGQVETRDPEKPVDGQTPVYPEPTGTDNGLPTTLKPSAAG